MRDISKKIKEKCHTYPVDMNGINTLLKQININEYDNDYETLLSEILFDFSDNVAEDNCQECEFRIKEYCPLTECRYKGIDKDHPVDIGSSLPQIVQMFIENGFDCTMAEGKVGGVCLYNLMYCRSKYFADVFKILISNGTNVNVILDDSQETIKEACLSEAFIYEINDKDYVSADRCERLAELIDEVNDLIE